jgi:hypothetical protein
VQTGWQKARLRLAADLQRDKLKCRCTWWSAKNTLVLGDLFVYFCMSAKRLTIHVRYVSIHKLRLLTEHATFEIINS